MEKLNIYQKINEIRKSVDYIQKDKSVSTGSSGSYKAVTHDAVTGILRKHLIEHGIVCVPNQISGAMAPRDKEEQKQLRYEGRYSFEFVNADNPAEKITVCVESHAMDNADKAPGKAISYAKKYAVLKLFEIETGEDEESRYQEADITDHLSAIEAAADMDGLRVVYGAAVAACKGNKDLNAQVVKAKDTRKKEIENATRH